MRIKDIRAWTIVRIAGVIALLVCLFVAVALYFDPTYPELWAYGKGYWQGRQEAQHDIQNGAPSLYTYGMGENGVFDAETGLTKLSFGCCVTTFMRGQTSGYNATVREHVRASGPPPNSRLRWINELSDPKSYYARIPQGHIYKLTYGDSTQPALPASISISLAPENEIFSDDLHVQGYKLVIKVANNKPYTDFFGSRKDASPPAVHVALGPEGSDTLFVRTITSRADQIVVCCLRKGLILTTQFIDVRYK